MRGQFVGRRPIKKQRQTTRRPSICNRASLTCLRDYPFCNCDNRNWQSLNPQTVGEPEGSNAHHASLKASALASGGQGEMGLRLFHSVSLQNSESFPTTPTCALVSVEVFMCCPFWHTRVSASNPRPLQQTTQASARHCDWKTRCMQFVGLLLALQIKISFMLPYRSLQCLLLLRAARRAGWGSDTATHGQVRAPEHEGSPTSSPSSSLKLRWNLLAILLQRTSGPPVRDQTLILHPCSETRPSYKPIEAQTPEELNLEALNVKVSASTDPLNALRASRKQTNKQTNK